MSTARRFWAIRGYEEGQIQALLPPSEEQQIEDLADNQRKRKETVRRVKSEIKEKRERRTLEVSKLCLHVESTIAAQG